MQTCCLKVAAVQLYTDWWILSRLKNDANDISIYTCTHALTRIHMYVCIFVCMYVCIFVCVYVCIFVCMCVCIFVCMYICMCVKEREGESVRVCK